MAKNLGNLVLKVQMENKQLLGKLEQSEKRLKRFQSRTNKMASAFKDAFVNVMIPALTAFGALAGKTFADFEDQMLRVGAISGATSLEMAQLTERAREMGATTRYTASEAAQGLQFLSMAGLTAKESMEALDETLQLALISGVELGRAADILTNVMSGFQLQVEDLTHVNDVLAASITSSNQNLDEQAEALSKVAGIAPATQQSLEDMVAITQVLANQGIKAEESGTALKMMLTRLMKPTSSAVEILDKYGIAIQNADGTMRPLVQIMEDFEDKGVKQNEILEIFGQRAGPKFIAALAEGADKLKLMSAELKLSEGAAGNMAKQIDSGLKANVLELNSKVQDLMLAMGSEGGLGEVLNGVVESLKTVVDVIKDNAVPIMTVFATTWITMKAAFQVGIRFFGEVIDAVVGAVQIAITAFLGAVKVVATQVDKLSEKLSNLPFIGDKFQGGTDLAGKFEEATASANEFFNSLKTGFGGDDRTIDEIISGEIDIMNKRSEAAARARKEEEERRKSVQEGAQAEVELAESIDNTNQSLENNKTLLVDTKDATNDLKDAQNDLADYGFKTMEQSSKEFGTGMTKAMDEAARGMILNFQDIGDAFEQMGKRMLNTLAEVIYQQTVGNTIAEFGKSIFGTGGILNFGSLLSGARAEGGPVSAGGNYLVGEEGPELFVPNTGGTIIPADVTASLGSGSNTTIIQNISISPDVPSTTRRVILEQLPMIKEAAAAGVEQKVLRGGSYAKNIRGA